MALIELSNLKKTYGEGETATHVLHGVNLCIEEGEFVALMGPSGSGKSTLMHILGFLDRLSEGRYLFRATDVTNFSSDELAKKRQTDVGFVFQAFHLLSNSTVLENVMLPMMYSGVSSLDRKKRALEALETVGLSHRLQHLSNQLSGGERQRVAIARAIVNNPSVLFADEPTGNLDSKSGTDVLSLLRSLHKQGHTIIMVTHESEAAEYAERIIKLRDGLIVSDTKNYSLRDGEYKK